MTPHTTMLRIRRATTLGALAGCCVALSINAAASTAATATFSASFEAERYTHWDQPRGVSLIDCNGQHYSAANGEDRTSIKTRHAFKVAVSSIGRTTFWQFGNLPKPGNELSYGIEAHGVSTRSFTVTAGTTGGWCGGARTNAPPDTDCGTRLPVYQVAFSAGQRELTWSAPFAPRPRERFDFYNCPLSVPDGMHVSSFPTLPAKINRAALFGHGKRQLVIAASKHYGPTSTPVTNLGVELTASGTVTWKLTLRRLR